MLPTLFHNATNRLTSSSLTRYKNLVNPLLLLSQYGGACRCFEILIDPRALSAQHKRKPTKKKSQTIYSSRLIDIVKIQVQGGRGGRGSLSQRPLPRKHRLKPDGGHGGNGGSVIIIADPKTTSLKQQHRHVEAAAGRAGGAQGRTGRNGENLILRVPCGVVVKRVVNYDEFEESSKGEEAEIESQGFGDEIDDDDDDDDDGDYDPAHDDEEDIMGGTMNAELHELEGNDNTKEKKRETVVMADLDEPGNHVLVARGGHGGLGIIRFASEHGPLPDARELIEMSQPQVGERAFLELELKLIADVGLVGFPNAGKSSLLRAMSKATPEVAPYPFTTLHPILGCVDYRDGYRIRVADIPGLVEGAAQGRGKGHAFLRHVERTKALMYVVDAAGVESRDPVQDLMVLADELDSYGDGCLLQRRSIIVANKVDLMEPQQVQDVVGALADAATEAGIQFGPRVLPISAGVSGEGLSELSRFLRSTVTEYDADSQGVALG